MRDEEKESRRKGSTHEQTKSFERAARRPSKPNAYNYYKKLVQDFESLDHELQATQSISQTLSSKIGHLQAQQRESLQETAPAQQAQWEHERELQIEAILHKKDEVEALHARMSELDAQELRILAELQVLQEKQQQEIRTEAHRINEIVHQKTQLLEAELAKGRMDLECIAQLVANARSEQQKRGDSAATANKHGSIRAITDDIQQRRRREFDLAADHLNARLHAFEQESEAMHKKATDIRARKHRALQILSTNQQEAIQTFFTSPPQVAQPCSTTADEPPAGQPAPPSLVFSAILESLNQSGTQVGHLQSARNEKMSAQRQMESALRDAQSMLASGEKRIEDLQKSITKRMHDAKALHVFSEPFSYDGKWGIESYPPAKCELVYFMRGLVFGFVESAVAESESEPDQQVLENEIRRWQVTHLAVEHEERCEIRSKCAVALLIEFINEVVKEVAADIYSEFQSSCDRVRDTIRGVFHHVFFADAKSIVAPTAKASMKNDTTSIATTTPSSSLSSALFNSVHDQLRVWRNQRAPSSSSSKKDKESGSRESVQLLHQTTQPKRIVRAKNATKESNDAHKSTNESPKKKRFGFFSSATSNDNATASSPASAATHATSEEKEEGSRANAQGDDDLEVATLCSDFGPLDSRASASPLSSSIQDTAAEKTFWQQMRVEIDRISIPSHFSHCSCTEVSGDASILVAGTTAGEILLWDLQMQPPVLLRSHTPHAKASSKARISRIALSASKTRIVTLDQLQVVHVWSVNKAAMRNRDPSHTSECFSSGDPQKWKPMPLELLAELHPDSCLGRPALPVEVKQLVATSTTSTKKPSASVHTASPTRFVSTNFFASTTLLGDPTSVLCGASDGDILKYNLVFRGGQASGQIAAKFDAPSPEDLTSGSDLRSTDIKREFLRAHKHPVLFLACIQGTSSRSTTVFRPLQVLSIDSDAKVLLWEYAPHHFSGFGWFTPRRKYQLDLHARHDMTMSSTQTSTAATSAKSGEILQIAATSDEARVVLMVHHETSSTISSDKKTASGKLQFVQLLLAGDSDQESIQVAPVRLQLDFAGSTPPRFALTTLCPSRSPHLPGGHFLFVLLNNAVRILSLTTGEDCCQPISLTQHKSESSSVFNAIAVSGRCSSAGEKTHCKVVVTGDHLSKILVYRFQPRHQDKGQEQARKAK